MVNIRKFLLTFALAGIMAFSSAVRAGCVEDFLKIEQMISLKLLREAGLVNPTVLVRQQDGKKQALVILGQNPFMKDSDGKGQAALIQDHFKDIGVAESALIPKDTMDLFKGSKGAKALRDHKKGLVDFNPVIELLRRPEGVETSQTLELIPAENKKNLKERTFRLWRSGATFMGPMGFMSASQAVLYSVFGGGLLGWHDMGFLGLIGVGVGYKYAPYLNSESPAQLRFKRHLEDISGAIETFFKKAPDESVFVVVTEDIRAASNPDLLKKHMLKTGFEEAPLDAPPGDEQAPEI